MTDLQVLQALQTILASRSELLQNLANIVLLVKNVAAPTQPAATKKEQIKAIIEEQNKAYKIAQDTAKRSTRVERGLNRKGNPTTSIKRTTNGNIDSKPIPTKKLPKSVLAEYPTGVVLITRYDALGNELRYMVSHTDLVSAYSYSVAKDGLKPTPADYKIWLESYLANKEHLHKTYVEIATDLEVKAQAAADCEITTFQAEYGKVGLHSLQPNKKSFRKQLTKKVLHLPRNQWYACEKCYRFESRMFIPLSNVNYGSAAQQIGLKGRYVCPNCFEAYRQLQASQDRVTEYYPIEYVLNGEVNLLVCSESGYQTLTDNDYQKLYVE